VDEKRAVVNQCGHRYQQVQRSQFDAEKKVAVADTSIQNLQRTIWHMEEDKAAREDQMAQLQKDKAGKEEFWRRSKQTWSSCKHTTTIPRSRS
jgi:chromosome segregation protein